MYKEAKEKVHVLLHPELGASRWDRFLNGFIIILIILNVVAVMLETVQSIYLPYATFFHYFDLVSVIIFSVEYLLRLWSCTSDPRYRHPVIGRLKYIFSTDALIDIMAILPFYVHFVVGFDLRMLRLLRLLRFLRLFRLTSYMKSAKMVRNVFIKRGNDLKLGLVLFLFLIFIASSLLYFAEHDAQPKVFTSIPASLWWAIVTVTSVGYGDMVPITLTGKILTAMVTLCGVALLALPAGIITAGFLEEMRKAKQQEKEVCPHCGEELDKHS